MLTSKDANFIGFTFKKSDILKSAETSGMLLLIGVFSNELDIKASEYILLLDLCTN